MATVVICGGLSCKTRRRTRRISPCPRERKAPPGDDGLQQGLDTSASLASLATSGSLNSLNDDDVGPTKAIDEADSTKRTTTSS